MKNLIFILMLLVSSMARSEENLAQTIAYSEMVRNPEPCMMDGRNALKWEYTGGLEIAAMQDVYEACGDETIMKYAFQYIDSFVMADGRIRTYRLTDYNLDRINPGKTLFRFLQQTGEPRFHRALDLLRSQLATHPRNDDGGFWHKKIYPHQVWLDGIYMATPFLAEYTATFEPENIAAYEDAVNQILMAARHNYDSKTQLFRHACDVSRQMGWADAVTGQSQHCWGRALGWYMMAIVDALPFIPEGTSGRDSVLTVLSIIAKGIDRYKDRRTGLWYQVLDSPEREGNYLESSCSAMFIYSMLKAARLGYLPKKYQKLARRSYASFVKEFVYYSDCTSADGQTFRCTNIGRCCAVAGLSADRPGTFDYYVNEKKRDNDPKVVGPFIKASLEMMK